MRRIIIVLVAIIAMFAGSLVASVPASAEGGYTAKFVRDNGNCYAGTLVIKGMPGNQTVTLATNWGPPKPYGGFSYRGKGGDNPRIWRKHFSVNEIGGRIHKGKFLMNLNFFLVGKKDGDVLWLTVPACKKK